MVLAACLIVPRWVRELLVAKYKFLYQCALQPLRVQELTVACVCHSWGLQRLFGYTFSVAGGTYFLAACGWQPATKSLGGCRSCRLHGLFQLWGAQRLFVSI